MKVYITKWALTDGIYCVPDAVRNTYDGQRLVCVWVHPQKACRHSGWVFKPFWHESLTDACQHARKMREREIARLTKRLKRIKALEWE